MTVRTDRARRMLTIIAQTSAVTVAVLPFALARFLVDDRAKLITYHFLDKNPLRNSRHT